MKPAIKPDKKNFAPPTLDEVIAEIKKHLPESPEGAFCRSDVMNALSLSATKADWRLKRWREDGTIVPAGKINRTNAWGDCVRVAGYTFVGQGKK